MATAVLVTWRHYTNPAILDLWDRIEVINSVHEVVSLFRFDV